MKKALEAISLSANNAGKLLGQTTLDEGEVRGVAEIDEQMTHVFQRRRAGLQERRDIFQRPIQGSWFSAAPAPSLRLANPRIQGRSCQSPRAQRW